MILEMILKKINYQKLRIICGDMKVDILAIEPAKPEQAKVDPNVLYVADKNTWESIVLCSGANILLTGRKIEDKFSFSNIQNQNIIICNQLKSVEEVVEELSTILLDEHRFLRDAYKLTTLLFAQKSIQHIIDEAYNILQNPIFVMDSSFKLIAYKKNDATNVGDIIWHDLEQYGYYSYENIRLSKLDKRYTKITRSHKPIYVNVSTSGKKIDVNEFECEVLNLPNSYLKNSRIITAVESGITRLGSITILEYETPFEKHHFRIAQLLNNIILCHIQKNQEYHKISGFSYEYLLNDLLRGNIQNNIILSDRLKVMDWVPKENFFVFSVGVAQSPADLNVLLTSISELVPHCKAAIFENYIVFLINHNESQAVNNNQLSHIKKYLKENNLYGGLSLLFNDLLDMGKYYKQSVKAIELGTKYMTKRIIFSYLDCMMLDLVDTAGTIQNGYILELCHPSLFKLMEYDRLKKTEFTRTLYEYLDHAHDYVETSGKLCIHRNSLAYRIKKIEEIMKVNLTDARIAHHLYSSFLMLVVAKKRALLREFNINI